MNCNEVKLDLLLNAATFLSMKSQTFKFEENVFIPTKKNVTAELLPDILEFLVRELENPRPPHD
jgi:hypothetical protein